MKTIYHQNDSRLFEGFYESNLFNADSLYDFNHELAENQEYDIDYQEMVLEVSRQIVNEIESQLWFIDNCPIKQMDFDSLSSPTYYNYTTDKLNIKINVDMRKLNAYVRHNNYSLQQYLTNNYTTTSGFISFVPSNVNEFLKWDSPSRLDIIIDWYLYSNLDLNELKYKSAEIALEYIECNKYIVTTN